MMEGGITPEEAYRVALAHQDAGEFQQAAHLYRRLLKYFPGHPAVNHNLGVVGLLVRQPAQALPYLQVAVAAEPDNIEYHLSVCGALIQLGYMDDALAMARDVLARLGDNPRVRDFILKNETMPWFPAFQGAHAPARQVYMSALIGKLRPLGRPLALLEVGSFMGASLMTWAKSVERLTRHKAEIVCIDPWEGADMAQYDYAGSIDPYLADGTAHRVFRNNLKFMPDRVTVTELRGLSQDVLPRLNGRLFDLIYLDGCHLYPEVLEDLRACDGLLAEGGFICGDDLEQQLHEVDADFAMANARTDAVIPPGRDMLFHPGVTLGVGQFFGPVSAYRGFWVMRKTMGGYQPVSMAGAAGIMPHHWPEEYHEIIRKAVAEDGLLAEIL